VIYERRTPKKKSIYMDFFFGATEQNLLKLFESIIFGNTSRPSALEQSISTKIKIIY
jgi:hypothetical protein